MADMAGQRKHEVFRAVVREYLKTAEPVGSGTVVSRYQFGCSPATVRNVMAELEAMGLLVQPHTSAGRIPTERGYRFYVDTFVDEARPIDIERERIAALSEIVRERNEAAVREFAKAVATLTQETVFMSAGPDTVFVAGVSNLFRKPEFRESGLVLAVSQALDDIEQVLGLVDRHMTRDLEVFIGDTSPFGSATSAVVTRVAGEPEDRMIGILGPTRMDYDQNVAIAREVHDIFARMF